VGVLACLVAGCGDGATSVTDEGTPAVAAGNPPAEPPGARAVDLDALGLGSARPLPRLSWPTRPVHVTSTFGWRVDPVSGKGTRLHKGIDLRGAIGDLAMSIGDGRVRFAGHDPLLGNMVVVDHGQGLESWYGHLSELLVVDGLLVDRGAAVGLIGNTGRSAAPHLHLTVKLDGEAIDPLRVLGQPLHRPAALLPEPEPEPDAAGGSTSTGQDGAEQAVGVGTGGAGVLQPGAVELQQ
jgi:murein DD-endopeptidase MepM/ murein hydrolase activator NlpD